jgi:hypothetical protein
VQICDCDHRVQALNSVSIAGEVVTAATALAGLILVYLGSLASDYASYQPQEKKTVKPKIQKRALVSFVGLIISLSSAFLGVIGKWIPSENVSDVSTMLLLVAFAWGAWIAYMTFAEIT